MKRRIPLIPLQKAVYKRLSECQPVKVYDAVTDETRLDYQEPYITFGNFTYKPDGTKREDISRVTLQIDIWSAQEGRSEVQEIANDIIFLMEYSELVLEDDFKVVEQEVDFFESFPEEQDGYHGVITIVAVIHNMEGE